MKSKILLIPLILTAFLFAGCTPEQKQTTVGIMGSLAATTVKVVAAAYGQPEAGELASAGLHAAAEVLQGYIDKKPPLQIVKESPGVQGVGGVLVNYLKNKGIVTQQTVDKIHTAAQIAANITAPPPERKKG